jgi:hypothetical protein
MPAAQRDPRVRFRLRFSSACSTLAGGNSLWCLRALASHSRTGSQHLALLRHLVGPLLAARPRFFIHCGARYAHVQLPSTPSGYRNLRPSATAVIDGPVRLGVHHRRPARLIAVRVPQEVANQRRRDWHADARRRGQAVSQARLRLAAWTLFCTDVPPDLLSGPEVLVVARVRWQIELGFKLWKSSGHRAHSRSAQPWRVLCEVYATLVGLLIQHWVMVTSLWTSPDRSAWKATQTLRKHALHLASAFVQGVHALGEALKVVQRTLAAGCRLNKRKKVPCTFQLLLALTEENLA